MYARRKEGVSMKTLFWFLLLVSVTGLGFWFVISPWPKNPIVLFLIAVFFGVASVGGLWMLFMAIRYEKHPALIIILVFVPYAFLWYYFERVRPRRHMTIE
jgi:hypothetical protein